MKATTTRLEAYPVGEGSGHRQQECQSRLLQTAYTQLAPKKAQHHILQRALSWNEGGDTNGATRAN